MRFLVKETLNFLNPLERVPSFVSPQGRHMTREPLGHVDWLMAGAMARHTYEGEVCFSVLDKEGDFSG